MTAKRSIDWDAIRARLAQVSEALARGTEPSPEELAAVLERRAQALAKRSSEREHTVLDGIRVLVVVMEGARYGLPVEHLSEVVPLKRLTPVPHAPRELMGVMNLRGEVRSVLDLRRMVGIDADDEPTGYVLMLRRAAAPVGLCAQAVERIATIRRKELAPAADLRFVEGLTPDQIKLLDVEAVLRHAVLEETATAAD